VITLVESLQPKEGLSRELYSCIARCEACASNDYEVNCQPLASVGMIIGVVLNHLKDRGSRRARAQGIVVH
jgi:hypothetical protein